MRKNDLHLERPRAALTGFGARNLAAAVITTMGVSSSTLLNFATEDGLMDSIDANIMEVITRFVTFADTTIFPIVFIGLFLLLGFFGKDDKMVNTVKTGLKVTIVAFALLNLLSLFMNTLNWLVETLGAG